MESLVEKLGADGIEAKRQVRPTVQLCYPVPLDGTSMYLQHLLFFGKCYSLFLKLCVFFNPPAPSLVLNKLYLFPHVLPRSCTKQSPILSSASPSSQAKTPGVGGQAAMAALLCRKAISAPVMKISQDNAARAFPALCHHNASGGDLLHHPDLPINRATLPMTAPKPGVRLS